MGRWNRNHFRPLAFELIGGLINDGFRKTVPGGFACTGHVIDTGGGEALAANFEHLPGGARNGKSGGGAAFLVGDDVELSLIHI